MSPLPPDDAVIAGTVAAVALLVCIVLLIVAVLS